MAETKHNRSYAARRHKRIRMLLLRYMGGKCVHCGKEDYNVLQIDHVHGNGNADRAKYGGSSSNQFLLAVFASCRRGEGKYQLLCANCNMRKAGLAPRGRTSQVLTEALHVLQRDTNLITEAKRIAEESRELVRQVREESQVTKRQLRELERRIDLAIQGKGPVVSEDECDYFAQHSHLLH